MKTKEEKRTEFKELVYPVIKWLADNANPHATIVIKNAYAEMSEGVIAISTFQDDFGSISEKDLTEK